MRIFRLLAALSPLASHAQTAVPAGDFHQHLFSPVAAAMLSTPANVARTIAAADLIPLLDSAGIRKSAILSVAYMYGSPTRAVENEQAKVRAENEWTAAQAAQYPDRLRAICSVNPLKPYSLEEIAHCARTPGLGYGLKLHFGNSDVRTDSARQLAILKRVFRAANDAGMAIIVHMHANLGNRRPYGLAQGRTFLEELLPQAPDVPVQIAHLAGSGGAGSLAADSIATVFAEAIARKDPRVRNLWFDITSVADVRLTPEQGERVARRLRQIGFSRILYGSDAALTPAAAPRNGIAMFHRLPLTAAEFAAIAANIPPYMR